MLLLSCFTELTGPIPTELAMLNELEGLWLYMNALNGPIPPELGSLESLKWLSLQGNQLSGPIPEALGNLAGILEIELGSNKLTGSIPISLDNLTEIQLLQLESNGLQGTVSAALCASVSGEQLELSVDCNEVTCTCGCACDGTPPPVFGAITGVSNFLSSRFQGADTATDTEDNDNKDDKKDKKKDDKKKKEDIAEETLAPEPVIVAETPVAAAIKRAYSPVSSATRSSSNGSYYPRRAPTSGGWQHN